MLCKTVGLLYGGNIGVLITLLRTGCLLIELHENIIIRDILGNVLYPRLVNFIYCKKQDTKFVIKKHVLLNLVV